MLMIILFKKYNKIILLAIILILLVFLSKEFLSKFEVKQDTQINNVEFEQIIIDKSEDIAALGYSGQRKITEDKNGNFYIAYRKKYNGYYQIFVAKLSKTQNNEWIISGTNKPIAFIKSNQRVPSIAIDSKNIIHIVWYGSNFQDEPGNRQIKYSKSINGGKSWIEWKNIAYVDGYFNEKYWQEHPSIFVGDNDELYVVWEGKDTQNNHQQIKFSKSINNGQDWTQWINIDASSNNTQSRPSIVQESNRKLHVLMYSSLGEQAQQIWHSYSSDDGENWSVWQNISNSSFDSRHISISVDKENNLYTTWRTKPNNDKPAQIYFSVLKNNKWSSPVIVAASPNNQFFPSITIDKNNVPYIAWMESEKKYNFSKERPEDGKIYFSYLTDKFSEAKLVSSGNYNFYPNFSNYQEPDKIAIIYLKGRKLLEIVFNRFAW